MEVNLLTDNSEINTIINLVVNKYQTNTFIENLGRYILTKYGLEIDDDLNKICKLNQFLFNDNRVNISMIPVGDGITMVQKR